MYSKEKLSSLPLPKSTLLEHVIGYIGFYDILYIFTHTYLFEYQR